MSSRNGRSKPACFQGENRRPGIAATAVLLVELVVARFELVIENVGHCDELDRAALGRKGIGRGSGATTPAANQGHLDQVALARMDERNSRLRDGRGGRNQAGGLQEFTT